MPAVFEMLAILLMASVAWLWFDSLGAREIAVEAARRACAAEGVQFLDDTVMLSSLWPRRGESGTPTLRRIYGFEFSDTGNNRLDGSVTLLGPTVQALYLEPHCGQFAGNRRLT
jgi:hypothetical protein